MAIVDEKYLYASTKPKRRQSRSVCLFCGSNLKLNRKLEHVIPHWLIKYLEIEKLKISLTIYSPLEDQNTDERNFQYMDSFLAGAVCGDCNGGWMMKLENSNIKLIKGLISRSIDLRYIPDSDKVLLAKWAFKTAIVLNSASNYFKIVPDSDYINFYKGEFPENLLITASMHLPSKRYSHIENNMMWSGEDSSITLDELRTGGVDSYKIGLQFGPLILIVSYWPNNQWVYRVVKDKHYVLHSPKKMIVKIYDDPIFFIPPYDSKSALFFSAATIELSKKK